MPLFEIVSICHGGGYRYCRTLPEHPKQNSKGLYPLHRVLMENKLGRILDKNEIVHHKDENKSNDSEDNLEVLTREAHSILHGNKLTKLVKYECFECGSVFEVKAYVARLRISRNKNKQLFCTKKCSNDFLRH